MKKSKRIVTLSLCIALLITNALILAPEVGAASDTNKTETEPKMLTNSNISPAEDAVLTQRAIAIDEAKKEAQAAVSEQLAIMAQKDEDTKEEDTETLQTEAREPSVGASSESSSTSSSKSSKSTKSTGSTYDDSAESSSTSDEDYDSDDVDSGSNYAEAAYGYLMGIDNPDPNYYGCAISMSDAERDYCERMVMGEAGSCGFTGMALVAQCIRDTYVAGGYSSVIDVINQNGYYGSTSITPSETCKEVVSYIFDQGGSAVQHRIRVFYASNYCYSAWHEAQTYVCSSGYVRFFDM